MRDNWDAVWPGSDPGYISDWEGRKTMSTPWASRAWRSFSTVRGYFARSSEGLNWAAFTNKELTIVSCLSLGWVRMDLG